MVENTYVNEEHTNAPVKAVHTLRGDKIKDLIDKVGRQAPLKVTPRDYLEYLKDRSQYEIVTTFRPTTGQHKIHIRFPALT